MEDTLDLRQRRAPDALAILFLSAWVVASRLPYVNDFAVMGKDGPLYLRSMALGRDYDVPMPGNIGYVLLGKLAHAFVPNPVHAFEAVNIALTCVGVGFFYLFATLVISRPLALATAFALACNPMVWWHGGVIASYPVWLAVLPAIGWFGLRFVRERRSGDMLGATLSLGIGMVLRPDLLAFGSPLWFGCMVLGRARLRDWLAAVAILAACCAVWFFGTAWVLGGVDVYLEKVRAKHDGDKEGFSFASRGLVEGLLRNGTKYGLFLTWSAGLLLIPFAAEVVSSSGASAVALAGDAARAALGRAVVVLLVLRVRGERGADLPVPAAAVPRRGEGDRGSPQAGPGDGRARTLERGPVHGDAPAPRDRPAAGDPECHLLPLQRGRAALAVQLQPR